MNNINYLAKVINEVNNISITLPKEITDLTKKELMAIIHYLANYTNYYTLHPDIEKNLSNQKKLYEKVIEFKNLIKKNKVIRKKLSDMFHNKKIWDSHNVFNKIGLNWEINI